MSTSRRMKTARIPLKWEHATPQWMTAAIASRHPEARVADLSILTIEAGGVMNVDSRDQTPGAGYEKGARVVMEDLVQRGADPRDATRPMTVDQVANGLRGLARLHSRYWGLSRKSHPKLRWVKTWKPSKGWQVGLRKRIPIGLERGAHRQYLCLAGWGGRLPRLAGRAPG